MFTEAPKDADRSVSVVVGKFRAFGVRPSLFIPESPEFSELVDAARRAGMSRTDRFLVMVLEKPVLDRDPVNAVEAISHGGAEEWSLAYLEAFYGDDALLDPVVHRVRDSLSKRSNRLLLAKRGGEVAGTVALHVGGGYVGLYCLGTVPAMRGKGVAGALIWAAQELAVRRRTKVILQTFEADGVEDFYLKRGFRRAFAQGVYAPA